MIEPINSIDVSSIEDVAKVNSTDIQLQPDNTVNFADLVVNNVEKIDETLKTANNSIQRYALGEKIPTHQLMIELETAKYELQLAVEVRNKLVEAYQELLRMQL